MISFTNSEKNNQLVRVVFDTNVYISAILNSRKSREALVESFASEKIQVLISEPILTEIEKVLTLKFHRTHKDIVRILIEIRQNTIIVSPNLKFSVIKNDETDNRILECAIAGNAHYIVSGDRHHLLPLIEYQGIMILAPADFLKMKLDGSLV
jgi:uncharacterized protein